ncbi:MAG: tetratricopeptide repeat protein, partial [Candidatus Nitrosotenuis sp.]
MADAERMLSQAADMCEDGDFVGALKIYSKILKKNPTNIDALIDKGVALQNLGRLRQALRCFQKALAVDPKNITALVNTGSVLHSLGMFDEAIKCYDRALRIDKKCAM